MQPKQTKDLAVAKTVSLSPGEWDQLQRQADEWGWSRSATIREIFRQWKAGRALAECRQVDVPGVGLVPVIGKITGGGKLVVFEETPS